VAVGDALSSLARCLDSLGRATSSEPGRAGIVPACAEKIPGLVCLTTRLLRISTAPLYLDTANETARAVDARAVNSFSLNSPAES
jgi:hypothetical protein